MLLALMALFQWRRPENRAPNIFEGAGKWQVSESP